MNMKSRRWNATWLATAVLLTGIVGSLTGAPAAEVADAVRSRNSGALQTLLKQRADVNAAQADGTTALHWAAHWNDLETVNLLLRAGASAKRWLNAAVGAAAPA